MRVLKLAIISNFYLTTFSALDLHTKKLADEILVISALNIIPLKLSGPSTEGEREQHEMICTRHITTTSRFVQKLLCCMILEKTGRSPMQSQNQPQ